MDGPASNSSGAARASARRQVRIVLDADEANVSGVSNSAVIALAQAGVKVYLGFGRVIDSLIHFKFAIAVVDVKKVHGWLNL